MYLMLLALATRTLPLFGLVDCTALSESKPPRCARAELTHPYAKQMTKANPPTAGRGAAFLWSVARKAMPNSVVFVAPSGQIFFETPTKKPRRGPYCGANTPMPVPLRMR
jgi:hypothetical protein